VSKSRIKPYTGSLTMKALALPENRLARKAKTAINHQRARCYNPDHSYYKYYGAKGIRVEYDTRTFMGWYIENIQKFKGNNPTVGRIDHSKSYTLDNIEFQSREENSSESLNRNNSFKVNSKPIYIVDVISNKCIAKADSLIHASELTGMSVTTVSRHINGHPSKDHAERYYFSDKYQIKIYSDIPIIKVPQKNKIIVYEASSMKQIAIVNSNVEASQLTGVCHTHIRQYCLGKLKQSFKGYTFRYESS
jgi:hypothetical protein